MPLLHPKKDIELKTTTARYIKFFIDFFKLNKLYLKELKHNKYVQSKDNLTLCEIENFCYEII